MATNIAHHQAFDGSPAVRNNNATHREFSALMGARPSGIVPVSELEDSELWEEQVAGTEGGTWRHGGWARGQSHTGQGMKNQTQCASINTRHAMPRLPAKQPRGTGGRGTHRYCRAVSFEMPSGMVPDS